MSKHKNIFTGLIISSLLFFTVSCSKDDDPQPEPTPPSALVLVKATLKQHSCINSYQ
jgi:hypothetical protein